MKYLSLLSVFILCSCFKTTEQIQREQVVDNLSSQSSSTNSRISDIQEEVVQLRGAIEESNHKNRPDQYTKPLHEEIVLLKTRLNNQEELLDTLKSQSDEQKKYLEQVISTLEKLNLELTQDVKKTKKKDSTKIATLKEANLLFKAKKLEEAKEQFEEILSSSKKAADKAQAIHYLGVISYLDKDYDSAISQLSKLFNDYPKSPFLSSGLLVLAKCFQKNKMNAEGKQTLDELISRFPKSREAKEAKDLLSKL
jgi:TolA-binding protein